MCCIHWYGNGRSERVRVETYRERFWRAAAICIGSTAVGWWWLLDFDEQDLLSGRIGGRGDE
jgi:hypothetical protein